MAWSIGKLCELIWNFRRNVTTDNFFHWSAFYQRLKEKKITLLCTVRSNRKEIPKELVSHASRELFSSMFFFSTEKDNTALLSFRYKAKRNRNVLLLSTLIMIKTFRITRSNYWKWSLVLIKQKVEWMLQMKELIHTPWSLSQWDGTWQFSATFFIWVHSIHLCFTVP